MGQNQSQGPDGFPNHYLNLEPNSRIKDDKHGGCCESDKKDVFKKTSTTTQDMEQFRCVKTRIDKLIEDCLICENTVEDKLPKKDKTDITIQDFKSELKAEIKKEKVETHDNDLEKSANEEKDAAENKDVGDDNASAGNSDGKDGKGAKSEQKDKGPLDQMKVSDIISEMVSTEFTASHMYQLQKKTITTFNTFIDKVLDSTLQKAIIQEEVKTSEPSIIKLCTQSMISGDKESESNMKLKSGNNDKLSGTGGVNTVNTENMVKKTKITLKDHIEKLLEESIQKEMFSDNNKDDIIWKEGTGHKSETFNAQGILNDMILQGLKGGASKERPQNETGPRLNIDNVNKNQRSFKPMEKLVSTHIPSGYNGVVPAKDTHLNEKVPQKFANYDPLHGPHNHHSVDHDIRHGYKDTRFIDKREIRDQNTIHQPYTPASRLMLPNRSEHMAGKLVPRHADPSYNHLHPYTANEYFRGGFMSVGRLSPGHAYNSRDGKPVHHPRDCGCSICLGNSHQSHLASKLEPHFEPSIEKHSPNLPLHLEKHSQNVTPHLSSMEKHLQNLPPHLSHIYGQMMPASGQAHATHSPKYSPNQPVPKLVPPHPSKEHIMHLMPPSDGLTAGIPNNRRGSFSESSVAVPTPVYCRNNSDETIQHEGRYYKTPPMGPGNISVHAHPVMTSERPSPGLNVNYSPRQKEFNRTLSSQSGGSDNSDSPLDLSVKRSSQEPMRTRSASYSAHIPGPSKRGNGPNVNSFIKHLENSVDKYWQESNSPESSPPGISPQSQKYLHPNAEHRGASPSSFYQSQSPNMTSPQGSVVPPQQRFPSPHFAGGITLGQPLVNLERERNTRPTGEATHIPSFRTSPSSSQATGNQLSGNSGYMEASRSASNNVSKHEPIQNIIGQHDPNDILYLICRLCSQTYGSPYAFKKHFRSNHGFEPRNEHTIVQTISATKTAMHVPLRTELQEVNFVQQSQVEKCPTPNAEVCRKWYAHNKGSLSPDETKSQASSEDGETNFVQKSSTCDKSETKCLECPECGKTFQLNDFGSYKRHCRQHGGTKLNGPFTCSHCHSHFSDQKLLKEHDMLHLKDVSGEMKQNFSLGADSKFNTKIESPQTGSPCSLPCNNVKFENYVAQSDHSCPPGRTSELVNLGRTNISCENISTDKIKREGTPATKSRQSPEIGTSHSGVMKSAAESMTSQVCPDSSWDNVVKGDATSNNPDDACAASEECSSPKSESAQKGEEVYDRKTKVSAQNSESSDGNTEDSQDYSGLYKHKKFFRKRDSLSSQDGPEAKVSRLDNNDSDSSSVKAQVHVSGKVAGVVNSDSCDSSGLSDNGTTTSSVVDKTKRAFGKVVEVKEEKSPVVETKLEARHNLPFVWDRPIRAQNKQLL
ncbi:uncharacterized protein LOC127867859 [Dreissena polymorpha]|uniref:C2H2-type domain-containing protein n=1 Tax=Dreissena polymorpha TaxID=45954 RepID=A0A9D4M2X9_DREPO|nr:uncharacterized protein LOC127867859 [Dreissena polymorpha]XP_052265313.1 uncharacterized protein LOC127867859 [Dreissena polymorpha]XP_052265314.1 uncharacterized protein LOC127867859 [Dreissena polymorpha]XP_052265315.1 uncharacterized protein LOC127867859 [Dreissena polymorpha]XP_052265316.1 uncharacterized protein LOC127867859 [Dreissena polymorpha]KAH3868729.1 hypothetical protein DPMN_031881 [Dreissena polymorpha]